MPNSDFMDLVVKVRLSRQNFSNAARSRYLHVAVDRDVHARSVLVNRIAVSVDLRGTGWIPATSLQIQCVARISVDCEETVPTMPETRASNSSASANRRDHVSELAAPPSGFDGEHI